MDQQEIFKEALAMQEELTTWRMPCIRCRS